MMEEASTRVSPVVALASGIKVRKRASLARAISLVEDEAPEATELVSLAYKEAGRSRIIGVTGSPGVGKSTLVDGLIQELRQAGRTVGIVAVDPSSPFSGGAILGDRVRMRDRTTDPGVFFRSLATRGHLGGVSRHTGDVLALMEAFGFHDIIVETVGAGQSEVEIMRYAHTVVVVLAPGLGDDVQAIKAGILEIGDVFCINKADLPGTVKTKREIEMMLNLRETSGWVPPVLETVAEDRRGLTDLAEALNRHYGYLVGTGNLQERTLLMRRAALEEYLRLITVDAVLRSAEDAGALREALAEMAEGRKGPLETAKDLARRFLPGHLWGLEAHD